MFGRFIFIVSLIALGCAGNAEKIIHPTHTLELTQVSPEKILIGTPLTFNGTGFVPESQGTTRVKFSGAFLDTGNVTRTVDFEITPSRVSDTIMTYRVDTAFVQSMGGEIGQFSGQITLTVTYSDESTATAILAKNLALSRTLTPSMTNFSPTSQIYLGEEIQIYGSDFIGEGEGYTLVKLEGTYTLGDGKTMAISREISAQFYNRNLISAYLDGTLFGLNTGVFTGTLSLRNSNTFNEVTNGNSFPVQLTMNPSHISYITPDTVRRGQRLQFIGAGFLKENSERQEYTYFELAGTFTADNGAQTIYPENQPLIIVPTVFDNKTANYTLILELNEYQELEGLGSVPGSFAGNAVVVIHSGTQTVIGEVYQLNFTVEPQRQIVYLKYLPGFYDSLREFGLRNVSLYIKQRMAEVFKRDYLDQGINVVFVETPPTDFVEYSTIEIQGTDPNAAGLFGLDNTTGKDEGNVRFNDYVGGSNAATEAEGYYSFGGIFVETFLGFSPSLDNPIPGLASPRFDETFGDFIEALGGTPVEGYEYPSGTRAAAITEAIRILGNLLGHTIVHEIGHTLGLSSFPGMYHSIGHNGWIMDDGANRSFEERAEINMSPLTWSPTDYDYLTTILPAE